MQLLNKVEVNSSKGKYLLYQFRDGNAMPKLVINQVTDGVEVPVPNMYRELKRLNQEFSLHIDYEPNHRIKLNTREFGNEFMTRFKG
ncbi:hypothetical protein [Litchfieldia alkalitelluris]|uniref:hypothetical protein n=1 Tax=Litchfieldia alkalitelluris TaxID=304268 RepID=UPI0009975CA7|nr:hypothetical protein [Litchfieldia alkalitelluris]